MDNYIWKEGLLLLLCCRSIHSSIDRILSASPYLPCNADDDDDDLHTRHNIIILLYCSCHLVVDPCYHDDDG